MGYEMMMTLKRMIMKEGGVFGQEERRAHRGYS